MIDDLLKWENYEQRKTTKWSTYLARFVSLRIIKIYLVGKLKSFKSAEVDYLLQLY